MIDFRHCRNFIQLNEDQLQAFNLHAETVVEFNHWLAAGEASSVDREELSVLATEFLYDLLEKWSTCNNTLYHWTHAESKDFGNLIFIHAYYEPASVMLHLGMNEEGVYLQMTIRLPENFSTMPDNYKNQMLQLSHLGDFEPGEDNNDYYIIWPYNSYSVTDVLTNGCQAFELMYCLTQELKPKILRHEPTI
jgi:hypothetical protein